MGVAARERIARRSTGRRICGVWLLLFGGAAIWAAFGGFAVTGSEPPLVTASPGRSPPREEHRSVDSQSPPYLPRERAGNAGGGGACKADTDCWINGDCIEGKCRCDQGWRGENCQVLDLAPAPDPKKGSYVAPGGTSSWGLGVVRDPEGGLYHGYVSEFAHGCKLGSWGTNSYINHIVAQSPSGPWEQRGVAVGAWAHNARPIYSKSDRRWVLFHIAGPPRPRMEKCGGPAGPPGGGDIQGPRSQGMADQAWPFNIRHSSSPDGPWEVVGGRGRRMRRREFTMHIGVDNVGSSSPEGGVELTGHGAAKAMVPFKSFGRVHSSGRDGALGWDVCGGSVVFDDGSPLWTDGKGSVVTSMRVRGGVGVKVLYARACAATFGYEEVKMEEAAGEELPEGVLYVELVEEKSQRPALAGQTQDAAGCRGLCTAQRGKSGKRCTSYTWHGDSGGDCYLRTDLVWGPSQVPERVSGRPWHYSGDNPAPWIDPQTGETTVLYRTYSEGGVGRTQKWLCSENSGACGASLIGAAAAPSWRGPYDMIEGPEHGPISTFQYPYEENEDPFLWRTSRGWHALLHSNTWQDSRSKKWEQSVWVGRYAFSKDGRNWTFSPVPPFGSKVQWENGTYGVFERRERPFLLFDHLNPARPIYLYTGAQRYQWDEYTFSLIQRVQ
eukprot:Hpha_TRINITY_DN14918_c0_g1::TRINITY_DN14918_c0_g1_i1::g.142967::m.142967